jgi:hypothetical protein
VIIKVHVQPLAAGSSCLVHANLDHPLSDALTPVVVCYQCVDDEGVGVAIPRHIDEPDQTACVISGSDPTKAVSLDLAAPVMVEQPMIKTFGMLDV